ncbi:TVP38/TMEM64 family protein [Rubrivirga sp. IMCC43871]|uniref:TVP38/TMEM64 family protein n=1 Tax=Rubrivirga sp. IMCC43871 TaxID=3391575 RepID=UPI0039901BDC
MPLPTPAPTGPAIARERRASLQRRVGVSAVVLAALVAVVVSDLLHGLLAAGVALVEPVFATRPVLGALLFVALSAVSALLAFFSSGALVPVALDVWGPVGTGALLWIGWTLGGAGAYAAGRVLGGRAVARYDRDGRVARLLGRIRPETPLWVVGLIQLAFQSELAGAVLGAARYPVGRYLVVLAVVEVVFSGLAVAAGTGLVERQAGLMVVAVAAFVALGVGAVVVVFRRLAPEA